jgi:hypothetical protein
VRWVRSFSLLQERHLYELWQELARAATKPTSALEKKYGDFFAACMDVEELQKKGLDPVKPSLDRIAAHEGGFYIAAKRMDRSTVDWPRNDTGAARISVTQLQTLRATCSPTIFKVMSSGQRCVLCYNFGSPRPTRIIAVDLGKRIESARASLPAGKGMKVKS